MPVDCTVDPAMKGTTYDVGPSQAHKTIQSVPWTSPQERFHGADPQRGHHGNESDHVSRISSTDDACYPDAAGSCLWRARRQGQPSGDRCEQLDWALRCESLLGGIRGGRTWRHGMGRVYAGVGWSAGLIVEGSAFKMRSLPRRPPGAVRKAGEMDSGALAFAFIPQPGYR